MATVRVEAPIEKIRRIRELQRQLAARNVSRFPTPGDLAVALDPRTITTPALELIDRALVDLTDTPDGRLIISMAPQEGKSQRVSRRYPTWLLTRNPELRIAIASYEHGVARRWGRAIRDDIATHGRGLGLQVRTDLAAQHEWQLAGHEGGVYAVGIGGALTGRPADAMIIDDPIKDREQADSAAYRDRVWSWWTDVASTRLAPGAPVVLILTRWHEDDLAGRLLAAPDRGVWQVLNIPAEAETASDPLGRAPGEFMLSARGRSNEQWQAIKLRSGSRTWAALYQGRPSPEQGDVWQRSWWRRYDTLLWSEADGGYHVEGYEQIVQSWDMAFKDNKGSDWVVGQVWAKRGAQVVMLDQVRRRLSFTDTLSAVRSLTDRWPQAVTKLVEDKANGTAVIDALRREVPGMVPVNPTESKYARANAVSPFIEAGNVALPAPGVALFDVAEFIDEATTFPHGAHDDQVDAASQALARLLARRARHIVYT